MPMIIEAPNSTTVSLILVILHHPTIVLDIHGIQYDCLELVKCWNTQLEVRGAT